MDNKMDENQDLIDMDLNKFKDILSKESQDIDDKLNEIEITKRKDSLKIATPVDPHPEELEKLMEIDETDNTIVIENPIVCDRNDADIVIGAAVVTSPNNKSLGLIANYNSSSDSDTDSSSADDSDSSDDESSSSSSDSDSPASPSSSISTDDEEVLLIDTDNDNANKKKNRPQSLRVKGEKLVTELPPVEELRITVPETACTEIGRIQSIVDQLVLVDSLPGFAALDLDTVLFLEKGKRPLGKVFDVLGQISRPLYCIRFNSRQQISESAIEVGMKVYFAPQTEHTQYVILTDIMKGKGSDASWMDDIEPGQNNLDYSDDEQEREARKCLKQLRTSDGQPKSDSNRKHRTNDKRNYYPNANHHNQPRFRGGYNSSNDPNYNFSWHHNLPQYMMPGTSYANPYAMSMSGFPTQVSPHLLQYPPPPPPPPQESDEQQ